MNEEFKSRLHDVLDASLALNSLLANLVGAPSPEPRFDGGEAVAEQPPRALAGVSELAFIADPQLTDEQRSLIEQIINVFETGTTAGRYDAISIYPDGPDRIRQITYGRSQTTEYGNLRRLVQMYVDAGGRFADAMRPYLDKIGKRTSPLVDDQNFKSLLKSAGAEDPVMRSAQDSFFDAAYLAPALQWARDNGFLWPLSILVIYDSYIHSGGILPFLRSRFPERPPANGGNEETWIRQYVDVRHAWLTTHSNPSVRPSAYRTRDLQREIAAGNWQLANRPIMANGTPVGSASTMPTPTMAARSLTPAFLDRTSGTSFSEWSELEPEDVSGASPAAPLGIAGTAGDRAILASRILASPNIKLATTHPSGRVDRANARQNVVDTAAGLEANRSSYGGAPGGSVLLDRDMLAGMLALAETYRIHVTEICGGLHGERSRHYAGLGFDVNFINGDHVGASHPKQVEFRRRAAALGATEVLGPGDSGHSTHIHVAWPRR